MASISIRRLDDKIYSRLQLRAKKHGFSMEEEVRQILNKAVAAPERITDIFRKNFGKQNGVELDLENL